jgi:hypothetical protein
MRQITDGRSKAGSIAFLELRQDRTAAGKFPVTPYIGPDHYPLLFGMLPKAIIQANEEMAFGRPRGDIDRVGGSRSSQPHQIRGQEEARSRL